MLLGYHLSHWFDLGRAFRYALKYYQVPEWQDNVKFRAPKKIGNVIRVQNKPSLVRTKLRNY